ncbi:transposase [Pseudonocardia sp. ICBG1293]|uniref:transposase n=1 Tax=Pseudonocardia sp. ICBG1293 TaxID=2844382 RepID=UPI0035A8A8A7
MVAWRVRASTCNDTPTTSFAGRSKAYSSRAIRAHLRRRRIVAVIPEPADQQGHRKRRGTRGGRPPAFDRVDYRGRNVVERGFCEVKQWRGLATRYDKLALTYRGGVALKAIVTWLRTLEVVSERLVEFPLTPRRQIKRQVR